EVNKNSKVIQVDKANKNCSEYNNEINDIGKKGDNKEDEYNKESNEENEDKNDNEMKAMKKVMKIKMMMRMKMKMKIINEILSIVAQTSKSVNQLFLPAFLQKVSPDIINQCVILVSITHNTNFNKIEIHPTKKTAILKNSKGDIILEPINPVEVRKSIENIQFPKLNRISRKQVNQDPYLLLGYFANFETTKKRNILTKNKLKVSNLYYELLAFEGELS
ncbi:26269_t:CDS:2, partial [Gigaspora margarita]